jgi:FAD/FMN-containing dehydrogenase
VIHTDEASLAWAADDFGHHKRIRPVGVLRPGSAQDIQAAMRSGLALRARGQGHSTAGQAQIAGGVVVDMGSLTAIHEVTSSHVVVDAGARWSAVLAETLRQGLTPPVLTDYLELSVGGTISVGGIGGSTHQHGLQVDNVLSLEVLTADGEIQTCSAGDELFDRVRGGEGDYGIILRATVRLIPAHTHARRYHLQYDNLADFLADQRMLMAAKRFDYLEGQAKPGWIYEIEAVKYYTPPDSLSPELLDGLRFSDVEDLTYPDFLNRMAEGEALLRSIGDWERPHVWAEVFVPDSVADEFVAEVMADLTVEDIGEFGVILIYPFDTTKVTAPQPQLPAEAVAFMVALLRTAADDKALTRMLVANDTLRQRTLDAGGTIYLDWTAQHQVSAARGGGTRWR